MSRMAARTALVALVSPCSARTVGVGVPVDGAGGAAGADGEVGASLDAGPATGAGTQAEGQRRNRRRYT